MTKPFDPRTYYINLCSEIDDELRRRLVRYMAKKGYIGEENRISRKDLAVRFFGKHNPGTDRKIRKAKEGFPILSTSGKTGYYLPASREEIEAYVQENNKRIQALQRSNRIALKTKLPYNLPPTHTPQPRLFEELV